MLFHVLVAVLVWGIGLFFIARGLGGGRVGRLEWFGILVFCGVVAWQTAERPLVASVVPVTNRPIEVPDSGYVGSDQCQVCHEYR